jgi:hypothetical protein
MLLVGIVMIGFLASSAIDAKGGKVLNARLVQSNGMLRPVACPPLKSSEAMSSRAWDGHQFYQLE